MGVGGCLNRTPPASCDSRRCTMRQCTVGYLSGTEGVVYSVGVLARHRRRVRRTRFVTVCDPVCDPVCDVGRWRVYLARAVR